VSDLQAAMERLGTESHSRAAALRETLVRQLRDYLATVQVADERRFELARAASDVERFAEYAHGKHTASSAPAFLRAWAASASSRGALRARVQRLSEGSFPIPPLGGAGDDSQETGELRRQLAQRDRQLSALRRQLLDLGQQPLM
jgi:hypothetical protein